MSSGSQRKKPESGELHERSRQLKSLREEQDAGLEASGFESLGDEVWAKDGMCYGREAALQNVMRV